MPEYETIGNFTSCCRLCLTEKTEQLKPLFDPKADDVTLPEKISGFLDVKIKSNDKVTTMVCGQCVAIVNTWQLFKKSCRENQGKLDSWFSRWTVQQEISEMSMHIKEEPVDRVVNETIELNDEDLEEPPAEASPPAEETPQSDEPVLEDSSIEEVLVKKEPVEVNGDISEHPPELLPFDCDLPRNTQERSKTSDADLPDNVDLAKVCSVCNKTFSSPYNRKKHEKVMHGLKHPTIGGVDNRAPMPGVVVQDDDHSQASATSETRADKEVAKTTASLPPAETDPQKIQFAAGLKLFQNSTPPICQENLSKIELSYIEKCKAMVSMFKTLECACHKVLHPNLKGMLSHLRSVRIWFPVFTCYNCMITFSDRSSSYRHNSRCPRTQMESLIKLSNLKKRSEIKTRLYQNYRCVDCKYMFSFHEDYCRHINEEHVLPETLPCTCKCGQQFTDLEEYKEHLYLSCMIYYYCDICFITTKSLEEFQKHAVDVHDSSEGFILLQDDGYRKKKPVVPEPPPVENNDDYLSTVGKRKSSYGRVLVEPEYYEDYEPPAKKPSIGFNSKATTCPLCCKQYSNYPNMMRHYKTHTEAEKQMNKRTMLPHNGTAMYDQEESFYCCPDCGGMFSASEWDEHKESHEKCTCDDCGKVFQFQSELDQHRSVHLNLKVYRDSKTSTYKSTMLSPNSEGGLLVMCEICEAVFQSKQELKQHKLIHRQTLFIKKEVQSEPEEERPNEKKYECKPCNKRYSGYSGLWEHNKAKHPDMMSASSNFPKKCPDCDKILYTGGSYYMHRQMHERIAQTLAKNAQGGKQTARSRRVSVEEDANDDNDNDEDESYFTCKKCFKVFATKYSLSKHMKCHGISAAPASGKGGTKKSPKKVWCDVCHQSCDGAEALKRHKAEDHNLKIKIEPEEVPEVKNPFIFTCDVCTRTFTTKIALKKHKERHAQEDSPVVKKSVYVYCKYCKIPFATVDLLNKHMVTEHDEEKNKLKTQQQQQTKVKQFACNVCKKAFITAAALYAHQGWHKRGKVEKQIKTQEKLFRKMVNNLQKPKALQPPQHQCTTCLMTMPNDTALQIHILEKHRDVSSISFVPKCQPCNQEFSSKEEYDNHKRLHEVVEQKQQQQQQQQQQQAKFTKNFCCSYCPAAFSRADTLNTHVRTIHKDLLQNEYKYKCSHCEAVFDKQNALSVHLKMHDKQKNSSAASTPLFSCSICNMGFDVPKDLRAHTIKAHPF